jgi:hypothetical protein
MLRTKHSMLWYVWNNVIQSKLERQTRAEAREAGRLRQCGDTIVSC